jgi:hypothetical protein
MDGTSVKDDCVVATSFWSSLVGRLLVLGGPDGGKEEDEAPSSVRRYDETESYMALMSACGCELQVQLMTVHEGMNEPRHTYWDCCIAPDPVERMEDTPSHTDQWCLVSSVRRETMRIDLDDLTQCTSFVFPEIPRHMNSYEWKH